MPNTRTKQPGTRCVGAFCAVYGCSNYQGKTKEFGISYHSFPKNPKLRKIWMKKCRRADRWNPAKSYICSDHFSPDDFKRDFRAELMNCRKMNHLNPGVVPSRNLPLNNCTNSSTRRLIKAPPKKNSKKILDEIQEREEAPDGSQIHYLEYTVTEPGGPSLIEIHTDVVVPNEESSHMVYSQDDDSNSRTAESEPELEDDEDSLSTDVHFKRLNYLLKERGSEILFLELPLTSNEQ